MPALSCAYISALFGLFGFGGVWSLVSKPQFIHDGWLVIPFIIASLPISVQFLRGTLLHGRAVFGGCIKTSDIGLIIEMWPGPRLTIPWERISEVRVRFEAARAQPLAGCSLYYRSSCGRRKRFDLLISSIERGLELRNEILQRSQLDGPKSRTVVKWALLNMPYAVYRRE